MQPDIKMNEASRWRVELARELSMHYSCHPEVVMVCLGGSSSKGIADACSDLDIIVYWNSLDEDWIKAEPLKAAIGLSRTDVVSMAPGTCVESYHLDGLKVDFGHATMKLWEEWSTPLSADPEQIGMVGGFLASIPFYGEELFNQWHARLNDYPDDIAEEVIRKNMGFFVKGYLLHQCLERGDFLAYQDGMCMMLKRLISTTAALNKRFYSASEPRWIEYELGRMSLCPEKLNPSNIRWMLENPGVESQAMLYELHDDILGMVALQFPEMREKVELKRKRIAELAVAPCTARPEMPPLPE